LSFPLHIFFLKNKKNKGISAIEKFSIK